MYIQNFQETNVVFAENQMEYNPLPAHHNETTGIVTCCWQFSLKERLRLLLTGKLWHQVMTFNKPLQPQLITLIKPELT